MIGTQSVPVKRSRRWVKWGIELAIVLVLIFGVRAWQQRTLIVGEAPAFNEIDLQGQEVSLAAYRGKPMLLHFWASWCPICEMEQGSINSVIKAGWPLITVAYSSGEAEEVKRYMERKGISDWITIVDNDGELARQYGVVGVPTSYVLDSEGSISFREVGASTSWGLRLRLWVTENFN
ncbi:protein disulfide oxidoreductase [uncultured Thiothrix sp.]|uniref:protein disulfide oxidoreductase n=1 Tax=uncultured Thiothrix sp. TaxID=223185 RepID=UPI002605BE71|nr:protein disulfide oxidoreductase [uncultured Thiothrix sp.]HMT94112.1 protein disulfide oxidoreductase [Thiolinea sp.]